MRTLQISEKKAMELYKNGSDELKTVLEESFGKEFFQRKITDRIKTYEDACAELGIYSLDEAKLMDFGLTKHDIAYQKLATVVKALNEDWTPDVCDSSVYRWYPWFKANGSPSSFAFCGSYCGNARAGAGSGSRLKFRTRELAEYAAKSTPIKEALDKISKEDFPFMATVRVKKLGTGNNKMYYFT